MEISHSNIAEQKNTLPLTLFAAHAHLAVLGIKAMACVTILDRIIRHSPSVERVYTRSEERRNSGV